MAKDKNQASPVYGYLRQWFDFTFEHQGTVTGNHTAIYCWFIEQNNRMGWAKEFGAPRDQTMAAAGISSYNTYKKCFNDLIDWGFVRLVKRSKNQYFANVIALSKFDKAKYKALDKALVSHLTKQSESTVALTIPIDNYTNRPIDQIVVEYSDAINFFCDSILKRTLQEKYKISGIDIEKKFTDFFEVKKSLGELNNKSCSDISKYFLYWLPGEITRENNFNKNNKNGKENQSIVTTAINTQSEFMRSKWGDQTE